MCVYIAIIVNILVVTLRCMNSTAALEMQWLWVGILAGRALRQWQCTLEGKAWYVKVQGVYTEREC